MKFVVKATSITNLLKNLIQFQNDFFSVAAIRLLFFGKVGKNIFFASRLKLEEKASGNFQSVTHKAN